MRNKIYIADDEGPIRELLERAIEMIFPEYQRKIDLFVNGKSLYDKLKTHNKEVKLALIDNDMPEMTGLEVIKKCVDLYPDIPFIQMSGKPIREEALEAGAKNFLEKPFDFTILEDTLKKYL